MYLLIFKNFPKSLKALLKANTHTLIWITRTESNLYTIRLLPTRVICDSLVSPSDENRCM